MTMQFVKHFVLVAIGLAATGQVVRAQQRSEPTAPIVGGDVVFEEVDGLVAVEAEHFCAQDKTDVRGWYLVTADRAPTVEPDGDPPHVAGASGGAYLEILPDTRRTHGDKLVAGQNFSNEPGKMAILSYKVHFNTPGRYYVWARTYCTTTEDNGLHVGLDGQWPATGQRMQWTAKRQWIWNSKQRTEKEHGGVRGLIYLEIEQPGLHTISFSMREDGYEFDRWLMTTDPNFKQPQDRGPASRVKFGQLPQPFPLVRAATPIPGKKLPRPTYPAHWGKPPLIQTRDYVPLPGGYGHGSSTLAKWIQSKLNADKAARKVAAEGQPPVASAGVPEPQGSPLVLPRRADGDGTVTISGELRQWHKVTLSLAGPYAHELDQQPNPFTDRCLQVEFTHESGSPRYSVPGYFAADGQAGESSAVAGTVWRAHLSPDKSGTWNYRVSFRTGKDAALRDDAASEPLAPFDGKSGSFVIEGTDKTAPDFRAMGRLQYVGKHHLRFAGSGRYFLKAGPDAPETLLAYTDFDGTEARKENVPLKTWSAHVRDWKPGDPTWKNGKGQGLIGALNYLSSKGVNAFSFLPYNAGGDGDNVWPFVARDDKLHYDCSKLDQWGVVFDHATAKGLYLHFKMQENEMDDDRRGHDAKPGRVPESLDGGRLGPQRMLYCRELIARFGHALALNWNIGEENTQSSQEVRDMARYLHDVDPYNHHIVIHTFPNQQEKVYRPLLGDQSLLTGPSLQNHWSAVHRLTVQWIDESQAAGRPWVVANDEQNPASLGVPPDPGYEGFGGEAKDGNRAYSLHDIRKATLWGNLMAGGAGVEYYFGYKLPQNDLLCEDYRSRDRSWDYCRIALEFFKDNEIPFAEMANADELVDNPQHDNSRYCLAKPGELYLVYLPGGGQQSLDLTQAEGKFRVQWFNPRSGEALSEGSVKSVEGGAPVSLGSPPSETQEDWLVVLRQL
jgi:hypothetical protein